MICIVSADLGRKCKGPFLSRPIRKDGTVKMQSTRPKKGAKQTEMNLETHEPKSLLQTWMQVSQGKTNPALSFDEALDTAR